MEQSSEWSSRKHRQKVDKIEMSIQDLKTEFNKEIKALKKTQPEMKEFNWNFILEQNPFPHMVL